MEIWYEKHPVTAERKAELRAQGFKIIDAQFAPAGWVRPEVGSRPDDAHAGEQVDGQGLEPAIDANGDGKVSVAELRAALAERGIEIPAGAKKADLQALLDSAG